MAASLLDMVAPEYHNLQHKKLPDEKGLANSYQWVEYLSNMKLKISTTHVNISKLCVNNEHYLNYITFIETDPCHDYYYYC